MWKSAVHQACQPAGPSRL